MLSSSAGEAQPRGLRMRLRMWLFWRQVARRHLAGAAVRTVHFGGHTGAICRGMTQIQVARLFAGQLICVRAFDPATGAQHAAAAPHPCPAFQRSNLLRAMWRGGVGGGWGGGSGVRAADRDVASIAVLCVFTPQC